MPVIKKGSFYVGVPNYHKKVIAAQEISATISGHRHLITPVNFSREQALLDMAAIIRGDDDAPHSEATASLVEGERELRIISRMAALLAEEAVLPNVRAEHEQTAAITALILQMKGMTVTDITALEPTQQEALQKLVSGKINIASMLDREGIQESLDRTSHAAARFAGAVRNTGRFTEQEISQGRAA